MVEDLTELAEKDAARAGCAPRVATYKGRRETITLEIFEGALFVTLFVTSGRRSALRIRSEEVK
jgi:hypothetical protein